MLLADSPHIQMEMGADWNGVKLFPHRKRVDVRNAREIVENEADRQKMRICPQATDFLHPSCKASASACVFVWNDRNSVARFGRKGNSILCYQSEGRLRIALGRLVRRRGWQRRDCVDVKYNIVVHQQKMRICPQATDFLHPRIAHTIITVGFIPVCQ